MSYAWVSPVLSRLTDPEGEIRATDEQISWIAVDIELGTLITPFIASYLMDKFGRKWPMLGCVPAMVLSWILVLTSRSVMLLYIKRIIDGMVIGIVATIFPIYLAEIATTRTRGTMIISNVVSWNFGCLFQFFVGTYLSYDTVAWVNMIIPIFYFLTFSFLPDSPYYLMLKNKEKKATKSLAWFRDVPPNEVLEELNLIKDYLKKDMQNKESLRHTMANPTYRKCFYISVALMLATTMTGLPTIFSYASDMFSESDTDSFFNADMCSLIVVFQFLFISIIISFVIDKTGRRPLMIVSGSGCFLSHIGSAFYFCFKDEINCSWIPLVTIGSYCFFVSVGLSPVLTAFQGELFPSSIKSVASGLSVAFNTFISVVALKLYYVINVTFGVHVNYFLYASVTGLSTIWLYFYAPETKNKTFSEIYDELRDSSDKEKTIYPEELQTFKENT